MQLRLVLGLLATAAFTQAAAAKPPLAATGKALVPVARQLGCIAGRMAVEKRNALGKARTDEYATSGTSRAAAHDFALLGPSTMCGIEHKWNKAADEFTLDYAVDSMAAEWNAGLLHKLAPVRDDFALTVIARAQPTDLIAMRDRLEVGKTMLATLNKVFFEQTGRNIAQPDYQPAAFWVIAQAKMIEDETNFTKANASATNAKR